MGLHLGYRRPKPSKDKKKPGKWIARRYIGTGPDGRGDPYRKKTLPGHADDFRDANGGRYLSYAQAQDWVENWLTATEAAAQTPPATVRDVVETYIADRDRREAARHGRPYRSDASRRLRRYVLGQPARGSQQAVRPAPLADVRLADMREADLRRWRTALPDSLRATTVRRLTNDLRAALNAGHAAHRENLPDSLASAIKFGLSSGRSEGDESESSARDDQILSDGEIARLLAAAQQIDAEEDWDGDLWRMILVLTATGARFSQVARMRVRDCQIANGRLMVPASRKGRGGKKDSHTPVPVGEDVIAALRPVVAGRLADAPLLERWRLRQVAPTRWVRTGRGAWLSSSELTRPFALVRDRAELPRAIPYALRHSSIVRGIRANLPIRLVAAQHDTSVGIIEKHYSRFIVSGLEAMLRAAIVPLVPVAPAGENVVSIEKARATG